MDLNSSDYAACSEALRGGQILSKSINDLGGMNFRPVSVEDFFLAMNGAAADGPIMMAVDGEWVSYSPVTDKEDSKMSRRVSVLSFVMMHKEEMIYHTVSIKEPVSSDLSSHSGKILSELSSRAMSESSGYRKDEAVEVQKGLATILSVFQKCRELKAIPVFHNGAADIHALMDTSACCRLIGQAGFEDELIDLFGASSANPLVRFDTYRNPVASNVAKCVCTVIPGATISLSLTKLSKTLSLTGGGFPSIGNDAHSAPHDAKTTLLLAVLFARSTNDGTVAKLCEAINSVFVTFAENKEFGAAIGLLTDGGVDAVSTYTFVNGRAGLRSSNELGQETCEGNELGQETCEGNELGQEMCEGLQAAAKLAISKRKYSTKQNPASDDVRCTFMQLDGEQCFQCFRTESREGTRECRVCVKARVAVSGRKPRKPETKPRKPETKPRKVRKAVPADVQCMKVLPGEVQCPRKEERPGCRECRWCANSRVAAGGRKRKYSHRT